MNDTVETEEYRGHIIETHYDQDPESPRTWDNLGHIIYKNSRYTLGDEEIQDPVDWLASMLNLEDDQVERIAKASNIGYYSNEMLQELSSRLSKDFIALNVYSYIHSGVTISTGSFGDPWDSGQCGIIYVSKEKVREEYGVKRITSKLQAQVVERLEGEIETFDQYLKGDIYGFNVEGPYSSDSCWGYYGDQGREDMVLEAKSNIDYAIARNNKKHLEQLKVWIKNKVGYIYRKENKFVIQ